jgi:hypothetical protein
MGLSHHHIFDAGCVVGRHLKLGPGGLHTADHLLEEMDHFGVAEALAVDSLSRELHPAEGNARVLEAVAGRPRLHAAWSALPPGATDEQDPPAQFVARMRASGARALWLYPRQYRFTLHEWCIGELLTELEAAGVPLFIDYTEVGPGGGRGQDATHWPEVVDLCRRHPRLAVIVSEYRIRCSQRMAYRALDACGNLHLGLGQYWLHRGVEYVTRRWGSGRLIFTSNWPTMGYGPTLANLTLAEVDDADKLAIAGGNLRKLLSWSGPLATPSWQLPAPADELVQAGRSGRLPQDLRVYDCHGHLGGRGSHYHVPDGTLDDAVHELDRHHVRTICAFSFAGVVSDERYGNDIVIQAVRKYPDRFVGFTMLNPLRGRDDMLRELARCSVAGLRGIKLIPYYQGYPEEGPLIDVPCQYAHERRQIILNHYWGSAGQIDRLAGQYPDACFITGHSTRAYAEVMKRRPNLYVCTCPLLEPRGAEQMVAAIGADRLLMGSDLLDLPIAWGLGPILFARLSMDDKRLILGGNLQRLLKQYSLKD